MSVTAKILKSLGAPSCKALPVDASPSWDKVIAGDIQHSYRFLLRLEGVDVALIKDVSRPGYTISTSEHRLLNWHFHFPESIKWDEINFTIIELSSSSVADIFMRKLKGCSYDYPDQIPVGASQTFIKDLSKNGLVSSLGNVAIQMLKPDGSIHEQWILHGAFIKSVKFSDLSYGSEDLTNIRIGLSYDWAELKLGTNINNPGVSK